jgi:hypothetical protein
MAQGPTVHIVVPRADASMIAACLAALCTINTLYLRQHPHTPALAASGVRYRRETPWEREQFLSIPAVLDRGYGDCDDLACWRVAELHAHAIDTAARPKLVHISPRVLHIVVQRGNGLIEDPSRQLGMGAAE